MAALAVRVSVSASWDTTSTLQRISVSPCSTYTSPVKVAILSFSRSSSDAARIFTGSSRSGCRLFVAFGFPDDWRLIVPLLVLFVFFVIVVVGVSRWSRVGCDGENLVDASCPLLLQTSVKLYRISGHVVFLLTLSLRAGRDQTPRRVRAPNTSQPVSGIGGYAEAILQRS